MKNIFFLVSILLVLVSCGSKKSSSSTDATKDTTATKPIVADNSQKVTYQSATYYTGRVEFHFNDEAGADIRIDISNIPEDSGAIYPKYLLESGDTLEGPPGANPAMVGKPFLLIKNAAGDVKEIKAAN
jgi:hypothetical protein